MDQSYFFCYSERLKTHLKSRGFDYITHARAINSNKTFWLFKAGDDLTNSIREYKESRKGLKIN